MTDREMADALIRTWETIAQDVASTGGRMSSLECAYVCADYVYMYAGEEAHRSIMALDEKAFKRVAKLAKLSL